MSLTIRPATLTDIDVLADLLVADAQARAQVDPVLWALAPDARDKALAALRGALGEGGPPFRQQWLLAEADGAAVGMTHSILLPVPPIYAGKFGAPGLIMEDCFVSARAPEGTAAALLVAAEDDLRQAGAKLLLGSSIVSGAWEQVLGAQGYSPLTLYFAKSGLGETTDAEGLRTAAEGDLSAIVTASAANRAILHALHPTFWEPHEQADARFGAWMARSLTLPDRDMLVAEAEGDLEGYAIAQPSSALHFPAAHDISATGFMDDYFHEDYADPAQLADGGSAALALLQAAESRLALRGNRAALVVCPADWASKIVVLKAGGYAPALVWHIKT